MGTTPSRYGRRVDSHVIMKTAYDAVSTKLKFGNVRKQTPSQHQKLVRVVLGIPLEVRPPARHDLLHVRGLHGVGTGSRREFGS